MDVNQSDRDARVERILDELDDVEARIEELRPASQIRTMVLKSISAKGEELAELKSERARLTGGSTA